MQRILPQLLILLALTLASCAKQVMPTFGTHSDWTLQDNTISSMANGMTVNFGGNSTTALTNASNGSFDLNLIKSRDEFNHYDPALAQYIADVVKQIPLRIDSIEVILADQYLILATNPINRWLPDFVHRADGSQMVVEANPVDSDIQPHDELWRNFIFNDKKHQMTVVDRFVKHGKHFAIVYVLQSAKKGIPLCHTFNFNVSNRQNIQFVGTYLEALMQITLDAMQSQP
ncbi:MAG: hypothetical protein J5523_02065 [Muribaculaceae bacterium]|nr:hypothetical protein [Muribaculaceae bacterium]